MAAIQLDGASTTGHGNFHPTTCKATVQNVVVNGKAPLIDGDQMLTHCDPSPSCHDSVVIGSSTVFINGKSAIKIGDSTACGDTVADGSGNVFIG